MPKSTLVTPCSYAPLKRHFNGLVARKPWQYRVTASVVHCGTIDLLKACIATLRWQFERPYILVIDTGTYDESLPELEAVRAEDVEVHYIRAHAWQHSSAPVMAGLDLAMALTRTNLHYLTHCDVLLKDQKWIQFLSNTTTRKMPVVGYEMSDRSWITDEWRGMVGHTSTMLWMPAIRDVGAIWNYEYAHAQMKARGHCTSGWPDTETGFNMILREYHVPIRFVGHETNYVRYEDKHLIHNRSYPSGVIYGFQSDQVRAAKVSSVQQDIAAALQWTGTARHGAGTNGDVTLPLWTQPPPKDGRRR